MSITNITDLSAADFATDFYHYHIYKYKKEVTMSKLHTKSCKLQFILTVEHSHYIIVAGRVGFKVYVCDVHPYSSTKWGVQYPSTVQVVKVTIWVARGSKCLQSVSNIQNSSTAWHWKTHTYSVDLYILA